VKGARSCDTDNWTRTGETDLKQSLRETARNIENNVFCCEMDLETGDFAGHHKLDTFIGFEHFQ